VRRVLKSNGRSLQWIQERPISRNELTGLTQYLVDIHGQHEHQRLLDPSSHLDMLDAYASLESEKKAYETLYLEWKDAQQQLQQLLQQNAKRAQESDYLEFVAQEIESAKPKLDEDVALSAEEKILSQHEKLFSEVTESIKLLSEDSGSDILHKLKRVRASLKQLE